MKDDEDLEALRIAEQLADLEAQQHMAARRGVTKVRPLGPADSLRRVLVLMDTEVDHLVRATPKDFDQLSPREQQDCARRHAQTQQRMAADLFQATPEQLLKMVGVLKQKHSRETFAEMERDARRLSPSSSQVPPL